jgi:hypothetical protein
MVKIFSNEAFAMSLSKRRKGDAALQSHQMLPADNRRSSTVCLDAGVTRAAAVGHLYDAANSSHGDLVDLQKEQQSQREVGSQSAMKESPSRCAGCRRYHAAQTINPL